MTGAKLFPYLLAWFFMAVLLGQDAKQRRTAVASSGITGLAVGILAVVIAMSQSRSLPPSGLVKTCVGASFLLLWLVTLTGLFRIQGSQAAVSLKQRIIEILTSWVTPFCSGLLMGAAASCRFPATGTTSQITASLLIFFTGTIIGSCGMVIARNFPSGIEVSRQTLLTSLVALLLFATSSSPQLDLFSPLTMKVMKFIHDLVHQAFETMLIPDHLFFKTSVWGYIGLLFGNQVGFWGGLVIWLLPPVFAGIGIVRESPPAVAHIRQGVLRRRALAVFIAGRRRRLLIPAFTILVLISAVYLSRFPAVEYWDPKPIIVTMLPSREIFIPKNGEVELEDGKLHKFILRKNGQDVRFFFLKLPSGQLVATLDACAICKPEGYGQAEGSVICYYCKTLIPIETVGKPGGCNPVPIKFEAKDNGVSIDSILLYAQWNQTVQITSQKSGMGK